MHACMHATTRVPQAYAPVGRRTNAESKRVHRLEFAMKSSIQTVHTAVICGAAHEGAGVSVGYLGTAKRISVLQRLAVLRYAAPHMKAQAPAQAGAVREYADDELPWYEANVRMESQSARLHNEIVELTALLQPTEEEDAQRLQANKLLEGVVQSIFPGSSLEVRYAEKRFFLR